MSKRPSYEAEPLTASSPLDGYHWAMPQRSFIGWLALAAFWPWFLAGPTLAADQAAKASAAEPSVEDTPEQTEQMPSPDATEPVSDGPWDNRFWSEASEPLKAYICRREQPLAAWCQDFLAKEDSLAAPIEVEEVETKAVPDEVWAALTSGTPMSELTPKDLKMIRTRALADGDPGAMEALGYLYTRGLVVRQDYVRGYRWYGRAFLAGGLHVKANMDKIWPMLKEAEKAQLIAEFEAAVAERAASEQTPPNSATN